METPESDSNAVVVADGAKDAPLVRTILRKVGFRVLPVRKAGEPAPSVAVELAVVDADGANSRAIVEELHGLYPSARVLLLSDMGEEKLREVPGFGHIRGALRKPFKRSQLVGKILNLMDQRRVMTA